MLWLTTATGVASTSRLVQSPRRDGGSDDASVGVVPCASIASWQVLSALKDAAHWKLLLPFIELIQRSKRADIADELFTAVRVFVPQRRHASGPSANAALAGSPGLAVLGHSFQSAGRVGGGIERRSAAWMCRSRPSARHTAAIHTHTHTQSHTQSHTHTHTHR